jgi:copper(I)-binding protein
MRAFTRQAALGPADTFLVIRNLSGRPDELVAVRSPIASRVLLVGHRAGPSGPATLVSGFTVPAHGTLNLSPFGDDVVLEDPAPFEDSQGVPLTLVFRDAGPVSAVASVTPPGTP